MDNSIIASIVNSSAEKRIVGKIRIQKIFYLLEQLGLNSGITFSYHHYGPYSEELSNSLFFAEFLDNCITETQGETQFGNTYSIFGLGSDFTPSDNPIGELEPQRVSELVNILTSPTSVVIELAATIHWLRVKEQVEDWKAELKIRKSGKATDENIAKAIALLEQINLNLN